MDLLKIATILSRAHQVSSYVIFCRYALVVLFSWLLAGHLIGMAFKSTLLASLVSIPREAPVNTFQAILDNDMTFLKREGGTSSRLLKESTRETVRRVYNECLVAKDGFYDRDATGT